MRILLTIITVFIGCINLQAQTTTSTHAVSVWGDPKYPKNYTHFDYANPNALKNGKVVLSAIGSFDSFNPFIIKGRSATGIGLIYDSLSASSSDEPATNYGALTQSYEIDDNNRFVIFHLHKTAKFHDGHNIDAEDVAWTFAQLMTHGSPAYQYYYGDVEKTEIIAKHSIKFHFKHDKNAELPLILGQIPVLPKHYWTSGDRDFSKITLTPPLGSGPYKIKDFANGRYITYERVKDYWAKDLPFAKGSDNFDEIRYDYYRDLEVAREAFKAGAFDIWNEFQAKSWATAFDIPAREDGHLILQNFKHQRVAPMQGLIFNLRNPLFQNVKVREALSYAFDFEFLNKSIMYNAYQRTDSYFDNHILSASDNLPSAEELALLEPHKNQIPAQIFSELYRPPVSDGSGQNRQNLRKAAILLKDAGWQVNNGVLTKDNQEFRFEILVRQQSLEALLLHFIQSLKKLGIIANIRLVDTAQYQKRIETFDYDSTTMVFAQSDSPGNEQREYWGSNAAQREGSRNIIGIANPVIDDIIEKLISAENYQQLIIRTRTLDRLLLWHYYAIPMYFSNSDRIAHWNRFSMPDIIPHSGASTSYWWIDGNKHNGVSHIIKR